MSAFKLMSAASIREVILPPSSSAWEKLAERSLNFPERLHCKVHRAWTEPRGPGSPQSIFKSGVAETPSMDDKNRRFDLLWKTNKSFRVFCEISWPNSLIATSLALPTN